MLKWIFRFQEKERWKVGFLAAASVLIFVSIWLTFSAQFILKSVEKSIPGEIAFQARAVDNLIVGFADEIVHLNASTEPISKAKSNQISTLLDLSQKTLSNFLKQNRGGGIDLGVEEVLEGLGQKSVQLNRIVLSLDAQLPATEKRKQVLRSLYELRNLLQGLRDKYDYYDISQLALQKRNLHTFRLLLIATSITIVALAIAFFFILYRHKRISQEKNASEIQLKRLLENVSEGVYRVDFQSNLIQCNPALSRFLGYDNEEDLRKNITDIASEFYTDGDLAKEHLDRLSKGDLILNEVCQWRHRTGHLIWGAISAYPVFDEDGHPLYIEGVMVDMNDRIEAELNLRKAKDAAEIANRAKTEFLANMSHELRTPLNAIIGFSEILRTEAFGKLGHDNYRDYALDIHSAGAHLLQVINDILDVAKIEAGQIQLYEREFDVRGVIASSIRMLSVRAMDGEVQLKQKVEDGLPNLYGDETRVKQVLVNLISNSVKFTKSGGMITVNAFTGEKGELVLQVADTGIGIAEKDLKHVLSRFGQAQASYARNNEGTGLGLTLVQLIVDIHGGTFDLQSVEGVGTSCAVTFPKSRVAELRSVG